jgi:hypothetical protein
VVSIALSFDPRRDVVSLEALDSLRGHGCAGARRQLAVRDYLSKVPGVIEVHELHTSGR